MSEQARIHPFPRGPLFGAGALVLLTILLAGTARFTGLGTSQVDPANPVQTRDLRFEDRDDGSVAVLEAKDGAVVEILAPGTNGFVRGVMRGLARERRSRGIGDGPSFNLTLWRDGELSLTDNATGRTIELTAFGSTNRASFAVLLDAKGPTA